MRIGNRGQAEAALNGNMRKLNGGGCRSVYLDREANVVYKVSFGEGTGWRGYTNLTEYRHARTLRNQSDNGWIGRVYIPATSGYKIGSTLVLAMEYINGTPGSWGQSNLSPMRADVLWQLFQLGFSDMHAANYMWMSGNKVAVAPVDMGSPRYRSNPREHADSRCINGTKYGTLLQDHRNFKWRNNIKQRDLPPSCPCDCGLVRWDL